MPAPKRTTYLIHQRLSDIADSQAVQDKIEVEVDRIAGSDGAFAGVNLKIESEMDRLVGPDGILVNLDTRLSEIRDAIVRTHPGGDATFVGNFFLKALMGVGPGALSDRDPVGKVFCSVGLHDLGHIHVLTSFKTTKTSAQQLFNKLGEPKTPTLDECKALLRALNNIFGENAPGMPATGGGAEPTTTAA